MASGSSISRGAAVAVAMRSTRSRNSRAPVRRSEGTPAMPTLRSRWRAVVECFRGGGLGVGGGLGEGHARDGTEGFVGHTRFAAAWVRACV
jgi:hypothetical protein